MFLSILLHFFDRYLGVDDCPINEFLGANHMEVISGTVVDQSLKYFISKNICLLTIGKKNCTNKNILVVAMYMNPMRRDGSKKLVGATKILSQGDVEVETLSCTKSKDLRDRADRTIFSRKKNQYYDLTLEVSNFFGL